MNETYDQGSMTKERLQAVADRLYPGIALFARDVNLPEALARRYIPGLLIREKGVTQASGCFAGMVTTHRFVILSNHMRELPVSDRQKLYATAPDARFLVLGQHTHQGRTGIFLLHLPDDETWKLWLHAELNMDRQLYQMAVEEFTARCALPPLPELTTWEWLECCAAPMGLSGDGRFWPLEDGAASAAPRPRPDARRTKHSRYLGCLLGGAVGDALGYPVEFIGEDSIRAKYGPEGIRTLAQAGHPARISDDTQMTLFAANALVYTKQQGGTLAENLWTAYREWLATQGETERMDDPEHPKMWVYRDPRMHARRAPGNSCLDAIRCSAAGGTVQERVNNSKGCGTVMRAAPFGLAVRHDPDRPGGDELSAVQKMAVTDAALTHGHPLAWASSGILAQLIFEMVQRNPGRKERLESVIARIGFPENETVSKLVGRAVQLALDPAVSDLEGIHLLGEGWVAEEALAIAVFCAVRYQDDFAAGIRAAVNHKGDSDSTGAVCGNILGAWLGKEAVESAFDLQDLELREVIEKMADQLFAAVEGPDAPAEKPREETDLPLPEPMKPLRPVGLCYTPLTKAALQICFAAHKYQKDKSGLPYFIHPLHLAEQMETEEEVCTALLHDVMEDTDCTLEDLRQRGFPEAVLQALQLLTRDPRTDYLKYVARLRLNPIARRVKMADLVHNSDRNRLDRLTDRDRRRLLKYRMARAILEDDRYLPDRQLFCKVIPLSLDQPLALSVFYERNRAVAGYSIDVGAEETARYELDFPRAERLRLYLDPDHTLAEALARWAEEGCSCCRVEALLRDGGIPVRPLSL